MGGLSLTEMAKELLIINEDLPWRFNSADTKISDFELHNFNQIWGSTSLGFGGIGGQAITQARTYVFVPLIDDEQCYIYFAGRFAYSAPYCERLMNDIKGNCVAAVYEKGRYKVEQ